MVLWGGEQGGVLWAAGAPTVGGSSDSSRGLGQGGVCPRVQSLGPLKQERGRATGRREVLGAAASEPRGLPELRAFRGLSARPRECGTSPHRGVACSRLAPVEALGLRRGAHVRTATPASTRRGAPHRSSLGKRSSASQETLPHTHQGGLLFNRKQALAGPCRPGSPVHCCGDIR